MYETRDVSYFNFGEKMYYSENVINQWKQKQKRYQRKENRLVSLNKNTGLFEAKTLV